MMNTPFCSICGNKTTPDALFCSKCGTKIELIEKMDQTNNKEQPINKSLRSPTVATHFTYPKASILKRFMAYIIDSIITILPCAITFIICAILNRILDRNSIIKDIIMFGGAFISVFWLWYYSSCHDGMPNGQSYGKKMNGLMVLNLQTNKPCDKSKSNTRTLCLANPFECFMIIFSRSGKRLGDKIANTQVIELKDYHEKSL